MEKNGISTLKDVHECFLFSSKQANNTKNKKYIIAEHSGFIKYSSNKQD